LGNLRNLAFWFVLFILLLMLFRLFSGDASTASSRTTTYSDFVQAVENGQVSRATLDGETVTYTGPMARNMSQSFQVMRRSAIFWCLKA